MTIVPLVAFSLVGTLTAQAPDTSKPITFTCRAERIEQLLPELGKAAGIRLLAAPDEAGDVLVISVSSVPLTDLMSNIALVTGCDWRLEGTTYILAPSAEKRRAQDRVDRQTWQAAIQARLSELQAKYRLLPDRKTPPYMDIAADSSLENFGLSRRGWVSYELSWKKPYEITGASGKAPNSLRMGTRTTYTVTVTAAENLDYEVEFVQNTINSSPPTVSLDQLPKPYRESLLAKFGPPRK